MSTRICSSKNAVQKINKKINHNFIINCIINYKKKLAKQYILIFFFV